MTTPQDTQASTDTPESVAALTVTVIPYSDEDDKPDMDAWRMLAIGREGDIPDHVLDRIPAGAAEVIRQHSEAQAAEIARLLGNHKAELIEIGDAAGADLRHHSDALLHYSAVASVKRLRDERNGLLNDIDDAWEAFGTAGNRGVLTLAEQIGSLDRELDAALARATQAEAALAASDAKVQAMRDEADVRLDLQYALGAKEALSNLYGAAGGWITDRQARAAERVRISIERREAAARAALSTGATLPQADTAPGQIAMTRTTFGDMLTYPRPTSCDVVVLCVDEHQHVPVSILLPHQIYGKDLTRLMAERPQAEGITIMPYRNGDKVQISRAQIEELTQADSEGGGHAA